MMHGQKNIKIFILSYPPFSPSDLKKKDQILEAWCCKKFRTFDNVQDTLRKEKAVLIHSK